MIADLALCFALHTIFSDTTTAAWGPFELQVPEPGTLRTTSLAIAVVAAVMVFRRRWSVLRTLGACAALGLAIEWLPNLHG